MSTAIPFHFLIASYSNEKLIQAEKDYYEKIEDFSKVFCEKLEDNSITDYSYPFYHEFLKKCLSNHSAIRDIMHDRNITIPKRIVSQHVINVYEAVQKKGFKWVV